MILKNRNLKSVKQQARMKEDILAREPLAKTAETDLSTPTPDPAVLTAIWSQKTVAFGTWFDNTGMSRQHQISNTKSRASFSLVL